jgi:hypothetical protein
MDSLDPKAIKKLAAACRAAGIESFKGFGVEFTLAPKSAEKAQPKTAKSKENPISGPDKEIETEELSASDMLFWSVTSDTEEAAS